MDLRAPSSESCPLRRLRAGLAGARELGLNLLPPGRECLTQSSRYSRDSEGVLGRHEVQAELAKSTSELGAVDRCRCGSQGVEVSSAQRSERSILAQDHVED